MLTTSDKTDLGDHVLVSSHQFAGIAPFLIHPTDGCTMSPRLAFLPLHTCHTHAVPTPHTPQGFLATSFAEKVAKEFIARIPAGRPRVKWRVQVDTRGESVATYRCQHVNFVKYGHCQGELE